MSVAATRTKKELRRGIPVHNSGRRRIWPVWIGVFFAAVLGLALAAFHRDLPLETLKARYAGQMDFGKASAAVKELLK